jgi:uncharacterized membrane protein
MRQRTPPTHPKAEHPVGLNLQAIVTLERAALNERTLVDRVTAGIARVAGRTPFIVGHAVWFAAWIVLNTTKSAFDSYPFSLLNLVVALEAVFLTSVVL